jgi:MFS family permease
MESYRNVAAIVICLSILQMALGALSIVGPLALVSYGASSFEIGLVASAYAGGFLIGARYAPREIGLVGHIRAVCAFAGLAAVAAASLSISSAIWWWMLVQLVLGVSAASLLAAGESWIADAAPEKQRGAVLGFYLVSAKLGFLLGPFLAATVPGGDPRGFLVVVALLAACLIPVAATRRDQPALSKTKPYSLIEVWGIAPAAIVAAFVAGLVNGSVVQLYSVFVASLGAGGTAALAAGFNAAMMIGSVIAQWPAGLISDRFDRRLVIAVLAGVSAIAALAMAILAPSLPMLGVFALAAVWGAGALSFYGIAVAHAADRAAPGEAPSLMSGILMVWAIGSMVGPALAGFAMQAAGPVGLFYFAAAGLGALVVGMSIRRAEEAPVPESEKSDFAPTPSTSIGAVDLNPMSDE